MVEDTLAAPPGPPGAPTTPPAPPVTPAPRVPVVAPDPATTSRPAPPLLPGWAAATAAVVGGAAVSAAFPPVDLWWLAPGGVALLALATHRRRLRVGFALGTLAGLALFLPLLSWTSLYVGMVWLLLPALQALYLGLLGAAAAWVSPLVDRHRWCWPVLTGSLWVGQEALRDRTPFGGFPWGRLAFSQSDAPLVRLAAVGGAPLVTFATAVVGGLCAMAVARLISRRGRGHGPDAALRALGTATLAVVLTAGPVALPLAPTGTVAAAGTATGPGVDAGAATGTASAATIAIVQGNVPRLGLDFNAQRRAVLDNHVAATLRLAAQVREGTAVQPDLVVWPENAADVDPIVNVDAHDLIDQAARTIGAPILVGGLRTGPGTQVRNVGMVWLPGSGPDQTYVKRHPVPFAEYIPMRTVARWFSDKVDLVRTDFTAGTGTGVLTAGPVRLGDVICFEVAYDDLVRDTVTAGGQVLVVQTNNATFTVAEARQQLAMVRLRAVEHGRPALMASTVGVSGFVSATGDVTGATDFDTAAVVVRDVSLTQTRTMATALGEIPELALCVLAAAVLVASAVSRRQRVVSAGRTRAPGRVNAETVKMHVEEHEGE